MALPFWLSWHLSCLPERLGTSLRGRVGGYSPAKPGIQGAGNPKNRWDPNKTVGINQKLEVISGYSRDKLFAFLDS